MCYELQQLLLSELEKNPTAYPSDLTKEDIKKWLDPACIDETLYILQLKLLQNELEKNSVLYPSNLKELVRTALDSRIQEQVVDALKITQPQYILNMRNKGLLYDDGKRVLNNLDDVATHLWRIEKIQISERFLQDTFLQANGKKYSDAACKKALNHATAK